MKDLDDDISVEHTEPVSYRDLLQGPTAVRLVDVHKTLGGRKVLDGISIEIHKGEIFSIIGGSGAGKSVTLKNIVGLMRPDSGSIFLNGLDVARATPRELDEVRKRIGYVFQNAALLNSISVYENVALPLREHEKVSEAEIRKRVEQVLALVGMTEAIDKMPSNLSGGMRKRVSLARAIVRNPDIILYDEPTSGLDPVNTSIINELILDMQKKLGVTSILVSHDMESVYRVSNRIAMLFKGKFLKVGTPQEFKETDDPIVRQFIRGESRGPITDDFSNRARPEI